MDMEKNQNSDFRRSWLWNRFCENGCSLQGFSVREILEMIIDGDCSEGSDENDSEPQYLSARYGTLKSVFSADFSELTDSGKLSEKSAEKLQICRAAISKMRVDRSNLPINSGDRQAVFDYLKSIFFFEDREKLYMLSVDENSLITSARLISEGSERSVRIDFSRIQRYMFEQSEQGSFILAHNHPEALSLPSPDDISSTAFIKNKAFERGGKLLAHYVVGTDGVSEVPDEYNYAEFFFNRELF
jgi:DNA repair protein RadC